MPARKHARAPKVSHDFDLQVFLDSGGLSRTIAKFPKSAVIFSQGDPATQVMYLQHGSIKLSVLSKTGKEAIVAMLGPGDFFGEGCLAGQTRRMATATSMGASTVLVVEKEHMETMLHQEPALSDRFRVHMLMRNIRIEEDLVDQLFNSHNLSQETLAEMIGTTRSRVNFFMNKFRDLGFIEYNGGLKVNSALLSVVLHD